METSFDKILNDCNPMNMLPNMIEAGQTLHIKKEGGNDYLQLIRYFKIWGP